MKKVQFIIISVVLSFGLIISSALLSNAIDKSNNSEKQISIKGVSEKRIKADRGVVSILYFTKSNNLDEGRDIIQDRRDSVLELINLLRLSNSDYKIENVKIKPQFIGTTNRILNYDLSQTINISLKDIDKLDEIYEKLLELELKFNNLNIIEPEYFITNIEKYKNELLIDATKNAHSKAIEILKVNNNRTGDLKKLIQGQFEILDDKESTEDINKNEINQQYKKLRVVVTSIYAIEKIK
ncbi:MAG: SIMPL domain-containing protein [Leptotrichiaceae bacterium]|nr:SIMPL domain-containing protein [Leptotrichiaceae bacterium]MBP7100756.1 SIMPL domain-containing protein [Leptotrichiaceae bacterium]MBP7739718.1 SIMPL domain-containing protein [Leptotrichiaceae bacterium]MBP9630331.1 SIMPL domain-containing protein [Leptotrichiaceae bacterium]